MRHVRKLGIVVIGGHREMGAGKSLTKFTIHLARTNQVKKPISGFPQTRELQTLQKFLFTAIVLRKKRVFKAKYVNEFHTTLFL